MPKTISNRNLASLGFRVWRGKATRMTGAHTHGDIEVNFVVTGSLRYFFGGRFEIIRSGELALFWAGIPHQLVELGQPTTVVWVTIPLAWFLQWRIADRFRRRLLEGELVTVAESTDAALLGRWVQDFRESSPDLQEIVLLETEARLRRLARSSTRTSHESAITNPGSWMERITQVIGERYAEELTVADIAAAVKLHPNYLMRAFKRQCGMSLWDYVLRLRVSHAQRLLVTTDRKMVDIAFSSGFGSAARFYETFRRVAGRTPRDYRVSMRG